VSQAHRLDTLTLLAPTAGQEKLNGSATSW